MLPKIHLSIERWRKNTEYGVWVSNQGRVRLIKNKKFLEPRIDKSGYCLVFTDAGAIKVHRLVAYTWMGGKRNEKYTVDHINSNKRDNRVKNLRWVSEEINLAYAQFTKCNMDLEETFPQTSIEQDENTIFWKQLNNKNLDEVTRGRALLMLFSKGLVTIRTDDGSIPTQDALTDVSHKMACSIKLDKFAGRVLKAAEKAEKYCYHNWYVEIVK
jgi:hypothetical protein